jgi:hypothetical protein
MKLKDYSTYLLLISAVNLIAVLLLGNIVLFTSGTVAGQPVEWSVGSFFMWRVDLAVAAFVSLLLIGVLGLMLRSGDLWRRQSQLEERLGDQAVHLRLLTDVAAAAGRSDSIQGALQIALDEICARLGWPLAHVYLADPANASELVPSRIWHLADTRRFEPFLRATAQTRVISGKGFVGGVVSTGQPAWLPDIGAANGRSADPRAQAAAASGIGAALAFPVGAEGALTAILEFFAPCPLPPDEALLHVMSHLGRQLGYVMQRPHGAEQLDMLIARCPDDVRGPVAGAPAGA